MSTDFRPRDCMLASELFDGRLKKFGCREHGQADEFGRCLTDGRGNYLFVCIDDAGRAVEFTKHGSRNDPHHILTAIAQTFDTQIFSEDEPRFWGVETWEEIYTRARIGGAVMSNSPEFAAEQAASGRREAAFNALVRRHINYIAVVAAIARGEPTYDDYGDRADDEIELREIALAELVAADTAWREAFDNYQVAELFGNPDNSHRPPVAGAAGGAGAPAYGERSTNGSDSIM